MKINKKKLTILNLDPIGLLLKRRKQKLFHYFLPKKMFGNFFNLLFHSFH